MSEMERPGSGARPTRRNLIHAILAAVGAAIGVLLDGWPEHPLRWLTVAVVAAIGALLSLTALADHLDVGAARLLHRLRPSRPLRSRRLLLAVLALALFVGFGRFLVAVGGSATEWASIRLSGCPAPTEVRVLTTPEELTAAERLAEAYTLHTARSHHDCPTVRAYVYAASPDEARDALRSGWRTNSLRTLGPRPDVWLPGASRYALVAPEESSSGLLTAAPATSLGTTPVVLAIPATDVPPEFQSGRTGLSWADALALLDRLGWGVARPDPARSITGEFATVAMYASGNGDPAGLTEAAKPPELNDPVQLRRIENRLAGTLDRAGYPLGDAVDLLCRHRAVDPAPVALVITEQQMVQFNAGLSLGGRCAATAPPVPERALLAVYPTDTLSLDQPLISLRWADRSADQTAQVDAFQAWLAGAGKRTLTEIGLRPRGGTAGHQLSERLGALPGVDYQPLPPTDRALSGVRDAWRGAQRAGRVLLLLDASGSMRAPVGGGETRFDVAKQGVAGLAGRMSDRDEFGVWVFQGPGRHPEPLIPIDDRAGTGGAGPGAGHLGREAVAARLAAVRPGGDTPLYRAIVDGVAAVGPAGPDRISAVVVLTDGMEEGSGISAGQLVTAAGRGGVRVFVVAVGDARCATDAIRQVVDVTAGACHEADFANLDRGLGAIFDTLWGGTDR